MVDYVLEGYIREFANEFGIGNQTKEAQFEHFANYVIVKRLYPEPIELEKHATGQALGIDGVAIFVNDQIVVSKDEVDVFKKRPIRARFVFIQSKTSRSFEMDGLSKLAYAVHDFFRDTPKAPLNDRIAELRDIQKYILTATLYSAPTLGLYYVTKGTWNHDPTLEGFVESEKKRFQDTELFGGVGFDIVDAARLKHLYRSFKDSIERRIHFDKRTTLPQIEGVQQALIGVLGCKEFLKLISDDDGELLRRVFYENIRDYQGENAVNDEIRTSILGLLGGRDKFVLLNNGITVIARSLTVVGDEVTLTDYQVVNGCQTSHVLFYNKDAIADDLMVPVKLVSTDRKELTNAIIKATNRQTALQPEAFDTLGPFFQELERFYLEASPSPHKVYYERRSKQYVNAGIPDSCIISVANQTASFAAMFLDGPHHASEAHYSKLLDRYGVGSPQLFAEDHDPCPYFISGFGLYMLDRLFWQGDIEGVYRRFKYHMLMAFRIKVAGLLQVSTGYRTSRKLTEYCSKLSETLFNETLVLKEFLGISSDIETTVRRLEEKSVAELHKRQYFTQELIGVLLPNAGYKATVIDNKRIDPSRVQGTVSRVGGLGYGFIRGDTGDNVFVHSTSVRRNAFGQMRAGTRLEFTLVRVGQGFVAKDVVILDQ